MVGLLLAELGGQGVKVIPQRDNLVWHAWAKQRNRLSRNGRPGRSRLFEEIALVFRDPIFVEHAESHSAVGRLETHPWGHSANLCGFPAPAPRRAARATCAAGKRSLFRRTRVVTIFGIGQISPAPRAHLYLAPRTATGSSVE